MRDYALRLCQALAVLGLAPLLQGAIHNFEEKVQRSTGPSIFQPYRDLAKLFRKEIVVPNTASWIFWAAVPLTRDYLSGEETRIARRLAARVSRPPATMNRAKAESC